jgi:TonB family protein
LHGSLVVKEIRSQRKSLNYSQYLNYQHHQDFCNFMEIKNKIAMNKSILIILTFFPLILHGQQTKLIKNKENSEEYYVLKSDNSIRYGDYRKFGPKNSLLIKGHYTNGLKDSIWELYNSNGEIFQKIDVSKNDLVYVKIEDSEKDNLFKLINGNDKSLVALDRPPVYLGGNENFLYELAKNLQYPEDAFNNGISGRVYVSFIVYKNGKTGNYQVLKSAGHGFDEEAIRALKSIPENWFPGILNGNAVDIELSYPVAFTLSPRSIR